MNYKKATIIVKIIGIIANRYRNPTMNAIEHTSSPKIASPRDMGLPIPKGSGKTADNSWKLLHFVCHGSLIIYRRLSDCQQQ